MRGWYGNSQQHGLASRGIKSNYNNKQTKIIAYHGTSVEKPTIEGLKKINVVGDKYRRVAGIYFTTNLDYAEDYTKIGGIKNPEKIQKVELILRNPATRDVFDKLGYMLDGVEMREQLIKMGYDGVIDDYMDEIVVFYPSWQIGEVM